MHSHEASWTVEDNFVQDRMVDNSLIYKFTPLAKIRRRTKILNAKIRKYCGVKDYKHYVELKTDVIRHVVEDIDTDNSDSLSDTDYDIIYNSLRQTESLVDDSEGYIFTEDDCKGFKKKSNIKHKQKNNNNRKASKEETVPKKKPLQGRYNTRASQKRIDWQKVTKENKISHLSNNQTYIDNEENIVKNNNSDYLLTQSNNQSLSLPFDSQNSTSNIVKSVNKNMRESCIDSNVVINESNSQDTIFNEMKPSESEIQDYKEQNAVVDKSNTELDSQNPQDSLPKSLVSSSKLISLENIKGSDNKINTVNKLKNKNSNKLVEVNNKNLINSKNYSNTYESHKSKLLKNVRRNLTPVLEEADLMNNDKDIENDKNEKNELNSNQLLVPTTSCTRHSTPIKKIRSNLSPDQQKDSGFEDSQDRFIKIEQNNIKSSKNLNIAEKIIISPQHFEKIAEVEVTALENSEEDTNNDNILEKQDNKEKEFSKEEEEEKNSFQLNPIDEDIKQKDCFTNQENKTNFVKAEENIEKQQSLSPKENRAKNAHSKSCDNILKEENIEEEETSEEKVRHSLLLNEADKDAEIDSINCHDKTLSMELDDSCNIEKQQMCVLPKITCTEIINKKYTIINKEDKDINIEKNDINSQEEISKAEEIDNNISLETDNEEDNATYISPETKKRLQQQARLNLVVSSDSSPSDDEYITVETSRKYDDDSDTSSKDMFVNDKTNCKETNIGISCSKNNSNEATSVPIEKKVKVDSPSIKKEIRKQADKTVLLTSCTYEDNNSSTSDTNQNSLKEIQYCANVYNNEDNQNESIEAGESFQLKISENNISSISEESRNQSSRNKSSLLDKENFCDKSIQDEDRMTNCISEFGTRCKSRHEENTQVSTNRSNARLEISCHSRPYNVNNFLFLSILFFI